MKDPKEKEEGTDAPEKENEEDSNWDEHQAVDEEGNQIEPEDIK